MSPLNYLPPSNLGALYSRQGRFEKARRYHDIAVGLETHTTIGLEARAEHFLATESYPDPTAKEGDWSVVDLKPLKAITEPVTLDQIKTDPKLSEVALIKQSRLSVMPLRADEFKRILLLGKTKI